MASPTIVIMIPRSFLLRSAGAVAVLSLGAILLGGSVSHLHTHRGRQLAEMKCIDEVPLTPAMVVLSINIDLLSLRSFRWSEIKTFVGRCAHAPKDKPAAAHLLDARCTLP